GNRVAKDNIKAVTGDVIVIKKLIIPVILLLGIDFFSAMNVVIAMKNKNITINATRPDSPKIPLDIE
ncbi:hypothetical protein, partial [Escherichia coli]|uniref:hypothetical protein n=1 Tax=Escherichia coli TaxID=562 RepID=UPI002024F761